MTELRASESTTNADDAVHQQIAYLAALGCQRWAYTELTAALDLQLWPRDRGAAAEQQAPYRVTLRVVQRGVWRVVLCPADTLPAGVSPAVRAEVERVQISGDVTQLTAYAADQIVQCGLFGEVLYA
jgi:hypothetical protein